MEFNHKTVLLKETLRFLNVNPSGTYVDGTAGGGGLAFEIASQLSSAGRLVCIDQDPDAVSACKKRLSNFENVIIVHDNFADIDSIVHSLNFKNIDGVALDLGVSSHQLDFADRGFSYNKEAPLDMRMSKCGESAYEAVNFLSYEKLRNIISKYGEERFASKIAHAIAQKRSKEPIKTTTELAQTIKDAIPFAAKREGGHPARKTFQAIRIYVNRELDNLSAGLDKSFKILKKFGRIVVITFHSLEDRIVKEKMNSWSRGCICPSDFPICVCKKVPQAKILHKKAVKPSEEEINLNLRSRSAKLRACEKLL